MDIENIIFKWDYVKLLLEEKKQKSEKQGHRLDVLLYQERISAISDILEDLKQLKEA